MVKRLFAALQAAVFALAIALAVVVPTSSASADVSQTPIATGCAAGWDLLNVDAMTAQGYHLPSAVDASGNQNGFVCGLPLPAGFNHHVCGSDCPPVLYYFTDDDNPAQQGAHVG